MKIYKSRNPNKFKIGADSYNAYQIQFAIVETAEFHTLFDEQMQKWEATAGKDEATLEDIYYRFNVSRPAGFTGHSLSVSDVIVINAGQTKRAFYCDRIGFKEMHGFIREQRQERSRRRSA